MSRTLSVRQCVNRLTKEFNKDEKLKKVENEIGFYVDISDEKEYIWRFTTPDNKIHTWILDRKSGDIKKK